MLDLRELLRQASENGASDVHISAGASPRARIQGVLAPTNFPKMTQSDTLEILLSLLTPEKRNRFEEQGEIDLSVSISNIGRYRVNAYKQRGSITISLRIMDMEIPDAAFLMLPAEIVSLCDEKRGLVLITGPSGSGKSTVLASLIDRVNTTRQANIITLEDPIEYLHSHKESIVNQREIGIDTKDYHTGMVSAMRQDPDVLQLSAIQSAEVASDAITAAETGMLIFASMNTMRSSETIESILELFPEERRIHMRGRLSNTLRATLSRQLIPTLEGGMIPVYEILIVDREVREYIRMGELEKITPYISKSHDKGMMTMDESLSALIQSGVISKETALQAAFEPELIQ